MEWLELTITTRSESIELVADHLTALGYESFSMDDGAEFSAFLEENRRSWDYVDDDLLQQIDGVSRIRLYIEDSPEAPAQVAALRNQLAAFREAHPDWALGDLPVTLEQVRDEDWETAWKAYYQPLAVGEKLLVVPCWMEPDLSENRLPVLLDPGMIFGTGAHASTQMCMAALEHILHGGEYVVDLGCGSGILSIAALRLGADRAVGVDIDPLAPAVAEENAARNDYHAPRFTAQTGDVLSDHALTDALAPCDVLLANIVADVIIPLSPIAAKMLKPGGAFLCSGILDLREDEVSAAIEAAGFTITARAAKDDWRCFTAILPEVKP